MTLAILLLACQSDSPVSLRHSPAAAWGDGVAGFTLARRTSDGGLVAGELEIEVHTRGDGGDWQSAAVLERGAADRLELALVADNSGSEQGYLEPMQAALLAFGEAALAAGEGGRIGLVRVSTESEILLGLSSDLGEWEAATGEMYISNGWTALWDGVRLGNELLDEGVEISSGAGLEVCLAQPRRSIVVFTDGEENNSADEHETSYSGDGVDTSLSDLLDLSVLGLPTPVHALGIGHEIDDEALSLLGAGSGGSYQLVEDYPALATSLAETVEGLHDEVPVCFQAADCAHDEARILATDGVDSWEAIVSLPGLCGCTRTIGYWKTHEEAWPVDALVLGDREYSQAQALDLLWTSSGGDKSLSMAQQLIASKLNVAAGAVDDDVASAIEAADAWLAALDDGGGLPFGTRSWGGGEAVKDALDAWNNGETGPGHCE